MYTPVMSLKSAALFAFVGMLLLTILLTAASIRDVVSFSSWANTGAPASPVDDLSVCVLECDGISVRLSSVEVLRSYVQ